MAAGWWRRFRSADMANPGAFVAARRRRAPGCIRAAGRTASAIRRAGVSWRCCPTACCLAASCIAAGAAGGGAKAACARVLFPIGWFGFCRHSVASGQSLWRRDDGSLTKPPAKKPCRWRRGRSGAMPGARRFYRGGLYRWYGQLAGIYAMRQTALSWQYLAGAGRFYRSRPYTRWGWMVTMTASWATMARSYSAQSGCSWSPQAIKAARSLRRRSSAGALR